MYKRKRQTASHSKRRPAARGRYKHRMSNVHMYRQLHPSVAGPSTNNQLIKQIPPTPTPPTPPEHEGVTNKDIGGGLIRLAGMGLGGLIGSVGGPVGAVGGAGLGLSAGDVVSRMFGLGRYHRKNIKMRKGSYGKLRGRGRYTTKIPLNVGANGVPYANQIVTGSFQKPITVNSSRGNSGDVYMSHREFIGNVQASFTNYTGSTVNSGTQVLSTFADVSYPINAALQQTFPWLSQVRMGRHTRLLVN